MRSFQEIFEIAADRKGGSDALDAMLSRPKSAAELADVPDHRWLSQVTKSIFQAGFNWKVIEAKWSGFEEAFHGFDITRCAHLHPEEFDAILSNKAVVRNGVKLQSVQHNAQFAGMKKGIYIRGSAIRMAFLPKIESDLDSLSELCKQG